MLEIICTASLALSLSSCQHRESIDLTKLNNLETSSIIQENVTQKPEYLAKGKPYKSKYRREADREIRELRHHGRDRHRRERRYDDDHRGRRIHRDPHRQGQEVYYDEERDQYYTIPRSRDWYFRRGRYNR